MERTYVCMLVLACVVGSHAFDAMGKYSPATDVTAHAAVSQDVVDIADLGGEDYDAANVIYTEGKNSPKGDGKRTLQGMAQKGSSSALWQIVSAHFVYFVCRTIH